VQIIDARQQTLSLNSTTRRTRFLTTINEEDEKNKKTKTLPDRVLERLLSKTDPWSHSVRSGPPSLMPLLHYSAAASNPNKVFPELADLLREVAHSAATRCTIFVNRARPWCTSLRDPVETPTVRHYKMPANLTRLVQHRTKSLVTSAPAVVAASRSSDADERHCRFGPLRQQTHHASGAAREC
jgi:hypothetical protein